MHAARKILSIAAIAALASLTACSGGGGGSTAPSSTNSDTTTNPVATNPTSTTPSNSTATPNPEYVVNDLRIKYALKTIAEPSTYTAGALVIYNRLNASRLGAGVGALMQNSKLDTAAAAHLDYIRQNYPSADHSEIPGQLGYTGANPWSRMTAAGYEYSDVNLSTELLDTVYSDDPQFCIDGLLNSVGHLQAAMGSYRDVGIAYSQVAAGIYMCALELGVQKNQFPQLADTGAVTNFPYQSDSRPFAQAFYPSTETPNPLPEVGAAKVGSPIIVSMRAYNSDDAANYDVTKFELRDANGNVVPATILTGYTGGPNGPSFRLSDQVKPGAYVLIPSVELNQQSTYSVEFAGTNGTTPYAKSWTFKTY